MLSKIIKSAVIDISLLQIHDSCCVFCHLLAELPPSPRTRKQQNHQEPGAADAANTAKVCVCV